MLLTDHIEKHSCRLNMGEAGEAGEAGDAGEVGEQRVRMLMLSSLSAVCWRADCSPPRERTPTGLAAPQSASTVPAGSCGEAGRGCPGTASALALSVWLEDSPVCCPPL